MLDSTYTIKGNIEKQMYDFMRKEELDDFMNSLNYSYEDILVLKILLYISDDLGYKHLEVKSNKNLISIKLYEENIYCMSNKKKRNIVYLLDFSHKKGYKDSFLSKNLNVEALNGAEKNKVIFPSLRSCINNTYMEEMIPLHLVNEAELTRDIIVYGSIYRKLLFSNYRIQSKHFSQFKCNIAILVNEFIASKEKNKNYMGFFHNYIKNKIEKEAPFLNNKKITDIICYLFPEYVALKVSKNFIKKEDELHEFALHAMILKEQQALNDNGYFGTVFNVKNEDNEISNIQFAKHTMRNNYFYISSKLREGFKAKYLIEMNLPVEGDYYLEDLKYKNTHSYEKILDLLRTVDIAEKLYNKDIRYFEQLKEDKEKALKTLFVSINNYCCYHTLPDREKVYLSLIESNGILDILLYKQGVLLLKENKDQMNVLAYLDPAFSSDPTFLSKFLFTEGILDDLYIFDPLFIKFKTDTLYYSSFNKEMICYYIGVLENLITPETLISYKEDKNSLSFSTAKAIETTFKFLATISILENIPEEYYANKDMNTNLNLLVKSANEKDKQAFYNARSNIVMALSVYKTSDTSHRETYRNKSISLSNFIRYTQQEETNILSESENKDLLAILEEKVPTILNYIKVERNHKVFMYKQRNYLEAKKEYLTNQIRKLSDCDQTDEVIRELEKCYDEMKEIDKSINILKNTKIHDKEANDILADLNSCILLYLENNFINIITDLVEKEPKYLLNM